MVLRPAFVGDELILAERGLLMACSSTGRIRWIRRLDYVPYKADVALLPRNDAPQVVPSGEHRAVVCAPCTPELLCIDTRTGDII